MSKINNILNQLYFDKKKIDQCLRKKSQLPQKYLEKEALARMSSRLEGVSLQVGVEVGARRREGRLNIPSSTANCSAREDSPLGINKLFSADTL